LKNISFSGPNSPSLSSNDEKKINKNGTGKSKIFYLLPCNIKNVHYYTKSV